MSWKRRTVRATRTIGCIDLQRRFTLSGLDEVKRAGGTPALRNGSFAANMFRSLRPLCFFRD